MTHRLVQITDCHLFADRSCELRDVATWPRMTAVLDAVRNRFGNLDSLVVTGDTAHDEDMATYTAFRAALGGLAERLWIIPGNHDDRAALQQVFPDRTAPSQQRLCFGQRLEGWQVVGLDSQKTGEVAGRLGADQLDWFRGQLAASPEPNMLLFVHHPPVPVQSPWLDAIGLEDADAFWDVLSGLPQVKLVCSGHVHQESLTVKDGVTVLTTPAVGPQFRPRTEENQIDPLPPAARLIELEPDGSWTTQVLWFPEE